MKKLHSRAGIELLQLDQNSPSLAPCDVSSYTVVHNEMLRLPFLLDYYRKLGVNHLFFLDDHSTDGSREYLLQESTKGDVSVFGSPASYKQARGGLEWVEALMDAFGDGKWVLKLDADEILVYDGVEIRAIDQVTKFLEQQNLEGLLSFMLDMYPGGSISDATYRAPEPFWAVGKYFDRDVSILRLPPLIGNSSPGVRITGGVRTRLFYPELHPASAIAVAKRMAARKLRTACSKFGVEIRLEDAVPPALEKVPLRKWRAGTSTYYSAHQIDKIRVSGLQSVLLHFKYFGDFHEKVRQAVLRKQYFNDSSEYSRYASLIEKDPHFCMVADTSIEYSGPSQLISLGVMRPISFGTPKG